MLKLLYFNFLQDYLQDLQDIFLFFLRKN